MNWLLNHLETLTPDQKSNVVHTPGNCVFYFAHINLLVSSVQQVLIPGIIIDHASYSVQVEVMSENIPLLLAETDIMTLTDMSKTPTKTNTEMLIHIDNEELEVVDAENKSSITEETVHCDTTHINPTSVPSVVVKNNNHGCLDQEKYSWRVRKKKLVTFIKQGNQLLGLNRKNRRSHYREQERNKNARNRRQCWKLERPSPKKKKITRY